VRIRKIPSEIVAAVLMATAPKTRRYAALGVKRVHGVKPFAEAAKRDGNLDGVRELPLYGFLAGPAFVATHAPFLFLARCS